MKKFGALLLVSAMALSLVACGGSDAAESKEEVAPVVEESKEEVVESSVEETTEEVVEEVKVMSYADYAEAELDSEVVVEAYVQATQSWWDGKITMYTQDADGAYFVYNAVCSEEDAAKLVPGTKIRISGYKAEWAGEVELAEGATWEVVEGADTFIAEAEDVTALLGTDELIAHQNEYVAFKDMVVEAAGQDDDGNDLAFLYKWDNSGAEGDDLYFKVKSGDATYTFTVESYLCGADTEVYQAVKALEIGQTIDMEGFLYWYDGVNPHITKVTVK